MVSTMQLYEQELAKVLKQFEAKASVTVPKLYNLLKHAGQEPKEARATLESDLGKIWKLETISRYLPDESKDKAQQEHRKKRTEKEQSEKQTMVATITTDGSESPLVSTPSEPFAKGATEDREATRREKQGFKLQELTALLAQKDRTLIDMQEKLKAATSSDGLDEEYVHQLKQKIKEQAERIEELEETRIEEIEVQDTREYLPLKVTVRQKPKFSLYAVLNTPKLREVA